MSEARPPEDHGDLDRRLEAFVKEAGEDAARDVLRRLQQGLAPSPDDHPGPGKRLGDFVLHERIGRGGMGVIFEAEQDSVPGRRVAVKVLVDSAGQHVRLRRFRREIEVIGRLDHPHIVPILAADLAADPPWYAMKLIQGRTLREHLDAGERLDFGQLATLFRDLAEALDHAHRAGVVHRDVNARNVMIDTSGAAQLLDFGLAHDASAPSALTLGDDALGTAETMAPEQISQKAGEVCAATDVYGLGATLYRCLTGRPPFEGRTLHDLFEQVLAGQPRPPRSWRGDVPPDLEAICLQALSPAIGSRYTSAAAMADDLTAFLEYRPVVARTRTLLDRARAVLQRHRVASLAAALVLLAALGTWGHARWWRPRRWLDRQDTAIAERDLAAARHWSRRLAEEFPRSGATRRAEQACATLAASLVDEGLARLARERERDPLDDATVARRLDELSTLAADHPGLRGLRADHARACLRRELLALSPVFDPSAVSLWEGRLRAALETPDEEPLLQRHGELAVTCAAGPVHVRLHPPLEVDGEARFDEREDAALDLGTTPTDTARVPEGSYLLVAEGAAGSTRMPLLVRRTATQDPRERTLALELVPAEALGPGWRHVPAGFSILGGARPDEPPRLTWVEGFCIMEDEAREAWLHDLLIRGGTPDQHFALREMLSAWDGRLGEPTQEPAGGVRALAAGEVTRILNAREAAAPGAARWFYRLPRPDEWERAGRGADGRLYPWGRTYRPGAASDYHHCVDDDQHLSWRPSPEADTSPFGVRGLAGSRREICEPVDLVQNYGQGVFLTRGGSIDSRRPEDVSLLAGDLVEAEVVDRHIGLRLVKVALPALDEGGPVAFHDDFESPPAGSDLLAPGWVEGCPSRGAVDPAGARARIGDGALQIAGFADSFSKRVMVSHPVRVPADAFRLSWTATLGSEHPSGLLRPALVAGLCERLEWMHTERIQALSVNTAGQLSWWPTRDGETSRPESPDPADWTAFGAGPHHFELLARDGRLEARVWAPGEPRPERPTLAPRPLPRLERAWRPRHVVFEVGNLDAIHASVHEVAVDPLD